MRKLFQERYSIKSGKNCTNEPIYIRNPVNRKPNQRASIVENTPYPRLPSEKSAAVSTADKIWSKYGEKKAVWRCENRLRNGTRYCKESPTIEESILHRAVLQAINQVLENKGDFVHIFRKNVVTALTHGTEDSEYAKQYMNEDLSWSKMESLTDVELYNCPNMTRLPEFIFDLPDLQLLNIACNRGIKPDDILADWQKLADDEDTGPKDSDLIYGIQQSGSIPATRVVEEDGKAWFAGLYSQ